MEVLILSGEDIKSYKPNAQRSFTKKELHEIIKHLDKHHSYRKASSKFNTVASVIRKIEQIYSDTGGTFNKFIAVTRILNSKNETYFSEEELLNQFKNYTWEELSEEEKYFYKNYNKTKNKK
jgi:hypothetical protein